MSILDTSRPKRQPERPNTTAWDQWLADNDASPDARIGERAQDQPGLSDHNLKVTKEPGHADPLGPTQPFASLPPRDSSAHSIEDPSPLTPSIESLAPKWATSGTEVPEGPGWVHEVEHAGQRVLVRVGEHGVEIRGVDRRHAEGQGDLSARLPTLVGELGVPALAGSVIDGVVCALGPDGVSSRARLEQALATGETADLVLFAFDLLIAGDRDLRRSPLIERKRALRSRIEGLGLHIRYCDHVLGAGAKVFDRACELGLEGVVSKRVDSTYDSNSADGGKHAWVEVKCARRLNLVVGGFTAPHGSRRYLGALLLGSYDEEGRLIYRGKVGSGFCEDSLAQLRPQLERLRQEQPAFHDPPVGSQARGVSWVAPVLGVDVEYGELTDKGKLRHARFKGLREDPARPESGDSQSPESSPASAVHELDNSQRSDGSGELRPDAGLAMVRLSNVDKSLFPSLGLSKRDIADYIVQVAEWMLPHVRDRALTVVCCPNGVESVQFEHHHAHAGKFAGVDEAVLPEGVSLQRVIDRGGAELRCPSIGDALGLLGLVELDVVEIHTWGSRIDKIDCPDRLVFGLEPGSGTEFGRVVEAAVEVRDRLSEFGLTSYVKTAGDCFGGVGLDVVVPVQRRRAYAQVARFCRVLAERMVAAASSRYTLSGSSSEQRGKVRINHGGNMRQSTMLAPYSVCVTKDARVSMPLTWEELTDTRTPVRPEALDVRSIGDRVAQLDQDPWAGFFDLRQWITKASFRRVGINPDVRSVPAPTASRTL